MSRQGGIMTDQESVQVTREPLNALDAARIAKNYLRAMRPMLGK